MDTTRDRISKRYGACLAGAAVVIAAWVPASFAGGESGGEYCDLVKTNKYAGRAYSLGVDATILGVPLQLSPLIPSTVPDTGELPARGGRLYANLGTFSGDGTAKFKTNVSSLTGKLSASGSLMNNSVHGSGNIAAAHSQVGGLNLSLIGAGGAFGVGGSELLKVRGTVLNAFAVEKAYKGQSMTDQDSTLATGDGLSISMLGKPVTISGAAIAKAEPNTKIALPEFSGSLQIGSLSGKVVSGQSSITINEQLEVDGRTVTNAVHIKLQIAHAGGLGFTLAPLASIDVIVAHADAGISCGWGQNPNCNCKVKDFYTGGGRVPVFSAGGKFEGTATFSIDGSDSDSFGAKGHLDIIDHTSGQHISADGLARFWVAGDDPEARFMKFQKCVDNHAEINGACWIHVLDGDLSAGGYSKFGFKYGSKWLYPYRRMWKGDMQHHVPKCDAD